MVETRKTDKSSRRLLEAPQGFLDHILEQPGVTPCEASQEDVPLVYWLCHDRTDDRLVAGPAPPFKSVEEMGRLHVLRLSLRGIKDKSAKERQSTIEAESTPTTASTGKHCSSGNNVGTRLLWQDDWVNIWEFRIAAGERCPYHTHTLEYCFTNLSESVTQALDERGKPMDGEPPKRQVAGQTVHVDKASLGSHAVVNAGSTTFLQFIVEFKF